MFSKRIVSWLEREWKLQLYDETKRNQYLQKLDLDIQALRKAGDFSTAAKTLAREGAS